MEDIAQDTFARIYNNFQRRDSPVRHFKGYAATAARRQANIHRQRRARGAESTQQTPNSGADTSSPLEHTMKPTEGHDITPTTIDLIESVRMWETKGKQGIAVGLTLLGLSPKEIADRLDMTPNAASALLMRARQDLRKHLDNPGDV